MTKTDPVVAAVRRDLTSAHDLDATALRARVLAGLRRVVDSDVAMFYTVGFTRRGLGLRDWLIDGCANGGHAMALVQSCPELLNQPASLPPQRDGRPYDVLRPRPHERRAFLEDAALWSPGQIERSPFYARVFVPFGLTSQQRLLVYHGDRFVGWIGHMRTRGTQPFSVADRRRLQPLVPTIRTALVTADRLERAATPEGPGDLVVSPDGGLEFATPAGAAWHAVPAFAEALRRHIRALDRDDAQQLAAPLALADARITRLDGEGRVRYLVQVVPIRPARVAADAGLTSRQRAVASYAAAGATVPEIARCLSLSPETVRTHLRATYRHLDVANRVELAAALEAQTP